MGDYASISNAIKVSDPDEIYNLGAQSFVYTSWLQSEYTSNITGLGALRIFEAARQHNNSIKIYQASSSEQFGNSPNPQSETTLMLPRSPYAVAKLYAHSMSRVYRESYNMFVSTGICFNHASIRRGLEFVSRKITNGVARIKIGLDKELKLGNIRSKRDWTDARDIVEGMWMILNKTDKADDFVLASGQSHSVREICEIAFEYTDLGNWENYVHFDKELERPADIYELVGDYSKAKKILGWSPTISFRQMIEEMVDNDLILLKNNT